MRRHTGGVGSVSEVDSLVDLRPGGRTSVRRWVVIQRLGGWAATVRWSGMISVATKQRAGIKIKILDREPESAPSHYEEKLNDESGYGD